MDLDIKEEIAFKPKKITYLVSLLTFMIGLIGIFSLFLLFILIIRPNLRVIALQFGGYLLLIGLISLYISKFIYSLFKPITFSINSQRIMLYSLFNYSIEVSLERILHVEKQNFGIRWFKFNYYVLFSTDNKYNLYFNLLSSNHELEKILMLLEKNIENFYVKNAYYKNTFLNSMLRIVSTSQGKIGGGIIFIYALMTIIGGIAYVVSPPDVSGYKTWILFNPEYVLYFLPQFSDAGVLNSPNQNFWFGTDYVGRDIFSRMIYGTTITMSIAMLGAMLVTIFIAIIGLSSALYGGTWDAFIMRLADVLLTFPQVVWIILISVFSTPLRIGIPGGYFLAVYIGMSFVMWPFGARLVRSEVMEAMGTDYISAIKLVGASRWWILKNHVLPKVMTTIFLLFFYQLSDIIIGISLLGYLGFDSESTLVWGSDLAKAFLAENIQDEWWTVLFPSLFIFGIVFGLTLFSDSLRDIYASRFRGAKRGTLYSAIKGDEK